MKKALKATISVILAVCMLMSSVVVVFASSDEEYLSELRLIYANSYEEAEQILAETKLPGFKILNHNLNVNSGKIGVWLAYKTTTDINDAITDIAVMQMGGGYSAGNYKEMIKKSRDEYTAMSEIYLQAIEYFAGAYDADNFLANSACRQLNFYNGLDNYKTQKLGDLFVSGVLNSSDLATLFLQGNTYVLENIRSLLAMGVSYNEDGLHYLEKVKGSAAEMNADPTVFEDEDYDELATMIAPTITVFRTMFDELAAYEPELDYSDETFTELEIRYAEYMGLADMMRDVDYLNGQTLYDFCLNYTLDTSDYASLYPLVDALNDGQVALTKLSHYYDVVRYSMSDAPEELIDEEISEMEKNYLEKPISVFAGVDRSVYEGTFALTSAAYRQDAYTDGKSFAEALFGNGEWKLTTVQIVSGVIGVGLSVWAIVRTAKGISSWREAAAEAARRSAEMTEQMLLEAKNDVGQKVVEGFILYGTPKENWVLDSIVSKLLYDYDSSLIKLAAEQKWSFVDKVNYIHAQQDAGLLKLTDMENNLMRYVDRNLLLAEREVLENPPVLEAARTVSWGSKILTGTLYFAGAAALAYSVVSLYNKYYEHYHPEYDDVPTSMVDLVKTSEGDRYIKYDVVYEAVPQKDKGYAPGDLNAFQGQRWNALYYTKSYEAGKPLLAEFEFSTVSNRVEEGYLPVHRFGEVICYDLNKYNFSSASSNVFLSIEQSENQKSVVLDIPDVVGSIFGNGTYFLAGGIGLGVGVGATVGVQALLKKKKKGRDPDTSVA